MQYNEVQLLELEVADGLLVLYEQRVYIAGHLFLIWNDTLGSDTSWTDCTFIHSVYD